MHAVILLLVGIAWAVSLVFAAIVGVVLFVFATPLKAVQPSRKHVLQQDVIAGRIAPKIEGDFVVFLIGAGVKQPWRPSHWKEIIDFFTAKPAMSDMIKELSEHPESGFLGGMSYFGNPTLIVQYWRSADQLLAYARNPNETHFPAWVRFNRLYRQRGSKAISIYHETYKVRAGEYEGIYVDCQPFGLPLCAGYESITGKKESAAGRLGQTDGNDHPKEVLGNGRKDE